jgi:hypothetical protein
LSRLVEPDSFSQSAHHACYATAHQMNDAIYANGAQMALQVQEQEQQHEQEL